MEREAGSSAAAVWFPPSDHEPSGADPPPHRPPDNREEKSPSAGETHRRLTTPGSQGLIMIHLLRISTMIRWCKWLQYFELLLVDLVPTTV